MSLVAHAEREMRLAGLYDADADYDGMISEAVMKLVRAHSEEGHSGFSSALTLQIFNKVVNFKNLAPITSDPQDWMEVGNDPDGTTVYQCKRASTLFSVDGLKTWYDIDDPEKKNWPQNKKGE